MADSVTDKEYAYLYPGGTVTGSSITDMQRWYLLATLALPLDSPISMADLMRNGYGIEPRLPYPLAP